MSDDVNKDIQKAIKDAKMTGDKGKNDNEVIIPPPKTLKHGLDLNGGVFISSPKTVIAEVDTEHDK